MKLLIVSHACATPINQQFYAEVERQTQWELTIITPSKWLTEYGNTLTPERWPDYKGQLLGIPAGKSGDISLHFYRSIFIPLFLKLRPDVIYVHHEPYALATIQVLLANHLSLRCPIGFYSAQNILKSYPPPFRQTERLVFKNSQFAFPVSKTVDLILRKKGYKNVSTVLSLGIDPDIYFPHPKDQEHADGLRASKEEILIGYLGRLTEEKGLETLLRALKHIQDLTWRLVVIGAGSFETEFEELAKNLQLNDRITRFGYIPHPETPHYLSVFDILVLPSETRTNWKEQFGRVLIEAMACGTPVVGSDSGEIPILIETTGGGLTFPENQPQLLAQQLKVLILNPSLRSKLGQKGRQNVLKDYTNSSLAKRFAETIEKAVI